MCYNKGTKEEIMAKNKVVEKGTGVFKEFKEFIAKGNVFDMAVGVVIGGAFGAIVTSLVNDIIMPLVSLATGGIDFANWFVALDGGKYETLALAQEAGAATLNYGNLISVILNFLIIALCIFFVVKLFNKLKKKQEEAPAPAEPSEEVLLLREIRDSLKKHK
jgi:large conductance mechanosensitive channel